MPTYKQRAVHLVEDGDMRFEIRFPVSHGFDPIIRQAPSGHVVVGYLSDDRFADNPLADRDGAGHIHDRRPRHAAAESVAAFRAAMGLDDDGHPRPGKGPDPLAVPFDVYDHSGEAWSLHGGGIQDQWDTTRGAGALVPDDCCREHIRYEAIRRQLPAGSSVATSPRPARPTTSRGGCRTAAAVAATAVSSPRRGLRLGPAGSTSTASGSPWTAGPSPSSALNRHWRSTTPGWPAGVLRRLRRGARRPRAPG